MTHVDPGLGAGGRGNPYVGLRPFDRADSRYFFGRRDQTVELLELLHGPRFVAIIGSSGCGKSSLVRAGLIPALMAGFLVRDRDDWEIAILQPGAGPVANLSSALARCGLFAESEVESFRIRLLEEGVDALVPLLKASLGERKNLPLVVDQFEEIFAFRGRANDAPPEALSAEERKARALRHEEAVEFVAMLLGLASEVSVPAYVVLTMRSDFVGDCDVFPGLPEAMNRSRYLVPRLTRQQLRHAIEGPARLAHGSFSARLLDRVLNEVTERPDQLPVLQHALLRSWDLWCQRGASGPLELSDYERAGTLANALALDGQEALQTSDVVVVERIFRCITDTDPLGRQVRRAATTLAEVCRVARAPLAQVQQILDAFQASGRCFVTIRGSGGAEERRVEITHESLIRQWKLLRDWVAAERKDRDQLLECVRRSAQGKPLLGVDLAVAWDWKSSFVPTEAWARRYVTPDEFRAAMGLIDRSKTRHVRNGVLIGLAVFAATLALALAGFFWWRWWREKQAAIATEQAGEAKATVLQLKAENSQLVANQALEEVKRGQRAADKQARLHALRAKMVDANKSAVTGAVTEALATAEDAAGELHDAGAQELEAETRLELGRIASRFERWEQARTAFHWVLDLHPDPQALPEDRLSELQGSAEEGLGGIRERKDHDPAGALMHYENSLKHYRNAGANEERGRLLERIALLNVNPSDSNKEALSAYQLAGDITAVARLTTLTSPWAYVADLTTGEIRSFDRGHAAIVLGRKTPAASATDVLFDDPTNFVSREHARIARSPGLESSPLFSDMRSVNGTSLNATPLLYGRDQPIVDADVFVLAGVRAFQFRTRSAAAPAKPKNAWGIVVSERKFWYLTAPDYVCGATPAGAASVEPGTSGGLELRWQAADKCIMAEVSADAHADVLVKTGDYAYLPQGLPEHEVFPMVSEPLIVRRTNVNGAIPFQVVLLCESGARRGPELCCR